MQYLIMRSQLRQILQLAQCHQQQIPQLLSQKLLFRQTTLGTHMNIQLQGSGFQQMAGLLQIQQMFQQLLTVNNILIRG